MRRGVLTGREDTCLEASAKGCNDRSISFIYESHGSMLKPLQRIEKNAASRFRKFSLSTAAVFTRHDVQKTASI